MVALLVPPRRAGRVLVTCLPSEASPFFPVALATGGERRRPGGRLGEDVAAETELVRPMAEPEVGKLASSSQAPGGGHQPSFVIAQGELGKSGDVPRTERTVEDTG